MTRGTGRLAWVASVAIGCSYAGHRGGPSDKPSASAASTALPPPTERAPSGHLVAAPSAAPPATWSTRTWDDPAATLFPLVDGDCGNLEPWSLADGPLVSYGDRYEAAGGGRVHLARVYDAGVDPSGAFDLGFEPAAPGATGPARGSILAVGGHGTSGAWVVSEYAGRTLSSVALRARRDDAWETLLSPNMARHQASGYGEDGVAFVESGSGGGAKKVRVVRLAGTAPSLPELVLADADFVRLRTFPGGMAVLSRSAVGTALRIFDGTAVRTVKVPSGDPFYELFALAPDAIFANSRAGLFRVVGDELTLTKLAADPRAPVEDVVRSPGGDVWAIRTDGIRVAKRDGSVEARPLPEPFARTKGMLDLIGAKGETREEPGHLVGGVESDDPWTVGDSGKLYHWAAGAWTAVALPRPPFFPEASYHATRVMVAAKGDAFVVATSSAIPPGGKVPSTFHALLRTRRPAQTFRCDERPKAQALLGPTSQHGFRSWPPAAMDACATPFVVAFGPHEGAAGADYPKLAAAVLPLGKKLAVVDFEVDGATWVGFAAPKVPLARELAVRAAQALGSRAEVVCGSPAHVLRTQAWGPK